MSNVYYKYYQPNKMDKKDEQGDCTIRALSKVWDCTWLGAFDKANQFCRKYQVSDVFNTPSDIRTVIMDELGFDYTGISNKKGTKRPTVEKFAALHPEGKYLLIVANHVVACVDGKYYDTWDSGYKSIYGYYTLREY